MLFPLPPLRLEQPEDLYAEVPSCWWSRRRWVAYSVALYDLLYKELRATLRAPSVRRETFLAWAIAESGCADLTTGRECRPSVRHLSERIERHPRTVKRCRELARLLDLRQVVFRGRHRTKPERLSSYDRDDPRRGWTAVAALIESPTYAHLVDNSIIKTLLEQDFVTPLPRSGGSLVLSRGRSGSSTKTMNEGAPRCLDKKVKRKRAAPAYDPRAVKLASGVLRDERFPLWVREIPRGWLTAILTRYAIGGWDVDDVFGALDEWRISGKDLIEHPDNPTGYLNHLLKQIPVDVPPARLDRARTVALDQAAHAEWRRELEAMRDKRAGSGGMNEVARRIRDQLAARTTQGVTDRARDLEKARRELARLARDDS